ncbi:hypothetical protein WG66_013174 [Moniliophthora roreri]|nr:hypothetical protein WG66_013174 [Moniliophthora roreri]
MDSSSIKLENNQHLNVGLILFGIACVILLGLDVSTIDYSLVHHNHARKWIVKRYYIYMTKPRAGRMVMETPWIHLEGRMKDSISSTFLVISKFTLQVIPNNRSSLEGFQP